MVQPVPSAWLVRVRWGSLVAQTVTLLVGVVALGAPAKIPAFVVLGATALSNAGLWAWSFRRDEMQPYLAGALMVVDTAALTALLFLCGGPSNPFSTLYLIYVTLAALTLGMRWAGAIVAVSGAGYALLFSSGTGASMEHMHGHMHPGASAFSAHLQAMWVAFTVTAALIAYFVARVARELRERERELARAQRVAARAEKLASLSALAAGAAHELGSPLATIAVASRELERALGRRRGLAVFADDARLIRGEVNRCQRILHEMSGRSGEPVGEVPETIAVGDLMNAVRERTGATSLQVQVGPEVPSSVVVPARGLVQSLSSLVRNALDAGGTNGDVAVRVLRGDRCVRFEVEDRGGGIAAEMLARVGEPFFTTKAAGMGLGLFLATAFAQRWQGRLELDSQVGRGTRAVLELPFHLVEHAPGAEQAPHGDGQAHGAEQTDRVHQTNRAEQNDRAEQTRGAEPARVA